MPRAGVTPLFGVENPSQSRIQSSPQFVSVSSRPALLTLPSPGCRISNPRPNRFVVAGVLLVRGNTIRRDKRTVCHDRRRLQPFDAAHEAQDFAPYKGGPTIGVSRPFPETHPHNRRGPTRLSTHFRHSGPAGPARRPTSEARRSVEYIGTPEPVLNALWASTNTWAIKNLRNPARFTIRPSGQP